MAAANNQAETGVIAKALATAADEARECQDACNGSGVVFSFGRRMQAVCDASNALGKGTEWKNQHPIVFLFTYKIQALNGWEQLSLYKQYNWAESECKRIATDVTDDPATVPDYTPYTERSEYALLVRNL